MRASCLVLFACMLIGLVACEADNKPFDRQAWSNGDYRERGRMLVDLEKRHTLKGLSTKEVKFLLGEPNAVDPAGLVLTWHLDLGWTALFHMDLHIDSLTQRVDSVRVWD